MEIKNLSTVHEQKRRFSSSFAFCSVCHYVSLFMPVCVCEMCIVVTESDRFRNVIQCVSATQNAHKIPDIKDFFPPPLRSRCVRCVWVYISFFFPFFCPSHSVLFFHSFFSLLNSVYSTDLCSDWSFYSLLMIECNKCQRLVPIDRISRLDHIVCDVRLVYVCGTMQMTIWPFSISSPIFFLSLLSLCRYIAVRRYVDQIKLCSVRCLWNCFKFH